MASCSWRRGWLGIPKILWKSVVFFISNEVSHTRVYLTSVKCRPPIYKRFLSMRDLWKCDGSRHHGHHLNAIYKNGNQGNRRCLVWKLDNSLRNSVYRVTPSNWKMVHKWSLRWCYFAFFIAPLNSKAVGHHILYHFTCFVSLRFN